MGLIKNITAKSGIVISYWKITDWKINQQAKAIDIVLTPYISNDKKLEGYDPLRDEVRKVRAMDHKNPEGIFNNSDYTDYFSPEALERAAKQGKTIYNVMYEYVKEKAPEFQLAEDSL